MLKYIGFRPDADWSLEILKGMLKEKYCWHFCLQKYMGMSQKELLDEMGLEPNDPKAKSLLRKLYPEYAVR